MADKFNIADYFKKNVVLPKDTITIYTDGQTAWDYKEVLDEIQAVEFKQEQFLRVQSEQGRSITDTKEHEPDYDAQLETLNARKDLLLAQLHDSGVEITMRAMYPAELRESDAKATRNAKKRLGEDYDEEDLTEMEARLSNAYYLVASVISMKFPDGTEVSSPIKASDFESLEDSLDRGEYLKLIQTLSELNTAQAMRDAQSDAGFPGGLSEQAGE